MARKKIILSADSTCDLPLYLKEEYDVQYYPFFVRFRDKEYKDNVDIHPEDIFKGYYEDKSLPQTAAINVGEYLDHFGQFVKKGYEVIHVSLGGALSSANQNAKLAAEQLENVYVVNSCNLSTGSGQLVIRAGRMIKEGKSAAEIADELNKIVPHVHVSFVLDTLDFMAAGGRCPTVAAKAASMLKCKPGLAVNNADGSLGIDKMYRGKFEKVMAKYVADQLGKYNNIVTDDIFLTDSGLDENERQLLEDEVKKHIQFDRIHHSVASCTISSHCGPKCYGILFVTDWK